MEDFMYDAKKVFKKYRIETFLLILAVITTGIGIIMYMQDTGNSSPAQSEKMTISQPPIKENNAPQEKMYVDISGSVAKPNMYEATPGSRLKHVLTMAGGLTTNADIVYFSRYFNLAKVLSDEEKIYIPSYVEVNLGLFNQNSIAVNSNSDVITTTDSTANSTNVIIDINTASLDELESLPGIGAVTAQKIIDNRPYSSIEELTSKKVISNTTFEKISDLIQ